MDKFPKQLRWKEYSPESNTRYLKWEKISFLQGLVVNFECDISLSSLSRIAFKLQICVTRVVILFLGVVMFTARVWTKVKELTSDSVGKRVLVRARLHTTRGTGRYLVCVIKWIHSKKSFYIIFLRFQIIQHFLVYLREAVLYDLTWSSVHCSRNLCC